jgi:FlaA1/EpsC-like NDP-sugar epimerase
MPRTARWLALLLIQGTLLFACYVSAFWLRTEMSLAAFWYPTIWSSVIWVLLIKLFFAEVFGLFRSQFRYASIHEILYIGYAMALSSVTIYFLRDHIASSAVPKGVILIDLDLSILSLAGLRVFFRLRHMRQRQSDATGAKRRILVIGAGDAGEAIIRQMQLHPGTNMLPVGILDDAVNVQGLHIHRVAVLGKPDSVVHWAQETQATEILIAMPSSSGAEMRRLVELAGRTKLPTRTLPSVNQIISGEISIEQIREVEITDLLGREPVKIDQAAVGSMLKGKRVLVTGAGGSIGSELARQLFRFGPSELILLDRAEPLLFSIESEILALQRQAHGDAPRIRACVADVGDPVRIRAIFAEHRPAVVCHAAAHKHVPLMEINSPEAVKNNIFGTRCLAECAAEHGVQTFVMISTDKAINPTSVMGTTKRVAEIFVQALARRSQTNFVTVRFGNVLGSSGSVVPIFRGQIRNGGPVTVTHPDMQRYFMLIPEAVLLVLQAAALGRGGQIFVLDMGQPVRIVDMAHNMIELSGLRPGIDIEIKFTGLRPGEKLFEELRLSGEDIEPTPHERIRVVKCIQAEWERLMEQLASLKAAADSGDDLQVRTLLRQIVPEYNSEPEAKKPSIADVSKSPLSVNPAPIPRPSPAR